MNRRLNNIFVAVIFSELICVLQFGCNFSSNKNNFNLFSSQTGNGQQWHIVVKRFRGPNRRKLGQLVYNTLVAVRGIDRRKVKQIYENNTCTVVYGRYNSINDKKAQKDLAFIKSLVSPERGYLFLDAHLEPIPEPDPPINKAYLLENANGYWTLQIARFYGKGRKRSAVDMTNELRKQGIPAYVHHGPVISIVTIGTFPEDAVKAGRKGRLIGQPIPVSPELRRWQRKFPYMLINSEYAVFKSTQGKKKSARIASQIIRIPSKNGSLW